MNADPIINALAEKVGFEAVQVGAAPDGTHLRLIGRVPPARQPDVMALIDLLLDDALTAESWASDSSKWYFKPKGAAQKVYAWRLLFESKDGTPLPVGRIAEVISAMRPVRTGGPLNEIRLAGSSPLRNQPNNRGRGAAPMGQAVVGPMRRGY